MKLRVKARMKVDTQIASMISDHHEKKKGKARTKDATAVQQLFKKKKTPVKSEVEFNTKPTMEEAPATKAKKNQNLV